MAPAVLTYREDLAVPYAHDHVLLFEVHERGEYIANVASWDHNHVSKDFIGRLFEDSASFLMLIIKSRDPSVRKVLRKSTVSCDGEVG